MSKKTGSPYNDACRHYVEVHDGRGVEYSCEEEMDMTFCNENCMFATNNPFRSDVKTTVRKNTNPFYDY